MRLTQGQFSFLPDLTDEQITKQIERDICRCKDFHVAKYIT